MSLTDINSMSLTTKEAIPYKTPTECMIASMKEPVKLNLKNMLEEG